MKSVNIFEWDQVHERAITLVAVARNSFTIQYQIPSETETLQRAVKSIFSASYLRCDAT